MRELLFRAYMTCTLYVDDGEYSDAEKEVKFYLDEVALYSGSKYVKETDNGENRKYCA